MITGGCTRLGGGACAKTVVGNKAVAGNKTAARSAYP